MQLRHVILVAAIAGLLSGCGSAVHRGVIAMKIDDSEAYVCMNIDEVKVGDTVELYRNVCSAPDEVVFGGERARAHRKRGKSLAPCSKEFIANGSVAQLLNTHYSVVRFPAGTQFREGDMVEKAR